MNMMILISNLIYAMKIKLQKLIYFVTINDVVY